MERFRVPAEDDASLTPNVCADAVQIAGPGTALDGLDPLSCMLRGRGIISDRNLPRHVGLPPRLRRWWITLPSELLAAECEHVFT